MRIFSRAIIGAIAIQGIYFTTTFAIGYIKTKNYKPDWEAAWTNADNLPSEITFGYAPSPFLNMGAFIGTVLGCGILLGMYDKLASTSSESGAS